ncbi:MAG: glycoside hydrolase family 5 protein [Oscillospiraceae bacterium]
MKKIFSLLLPLILLFSAVGCADSDSSGGSASLIPAASTPDAVTGGFTVSGTELLDANGQPFVFRGINHAHAWFASDDAIAIPAIAATGANSIRIVLSDGGQWSRDDAKTVKSLIKTCRENKLIAILEVHDATGKDDIASLEAAAQYWIDIKDALIGNEAYVILNIANEWVGTWDSATWKAGYTQVIPEIRAAGIKNTLMVDAAGWGQYGDCIMDTGSAVFASDSEKNTMFSVHMYGTAGKNVNSIDANLDGVREMGLCVCVGEFGYKHSDGDVDESYIMKHCQELSVGYLGWSWKGNGGGVEYLDLAKEWDGSVLSSDWGEVLINGENGILATSQPCTVFE